MAKSYIGTISGYPSGRGQSYRSTPSWWNDPDFRSGVSGSESVSPLLSKDPTTMSDSDYLKAKQAYERWGRSSRVGRSVDEYSGLMQKYGMEPSKSRIGQIISGAVPDAKKQQSTGRTWAVENIGDKAKKDAIAQAPAQAAQPAPQAQGQQFEIDRTKEMRADRWNFPELRELWTDAVQPEQKEAMLALDGLLPTISDPIKLKSIKSRAKDILNGRMSLEQAIQYADAEVETRDITAKRESEHSMTGRRIQMTEKGKKQTEYISKKFDLDKTKADRAWVNMIMKYGTQVENQNEKTRERLFLQEYNMLQDETKAKKDADKTARKNKAEYNDTRFLAHSYDIEMDQAEKSKNTQEQERILRAMIPAIRELEDAGQTYVSADGTVMTTQGTMNAIDALSRVNKS